MYYAELLRARRALTWYGGIFLALVVLGVALAYHDGPPAMHVSAAADPAIGLGYIVIGALFAPVLLASFMAVGLDAELKTAAITWTRPATRWSIALGHVAVDVATLVVAWLYTVAVALLAVVALGLAPYLRLEGPNDPAVALALGLGCALMWYGLLVLMTVLLPGRGNAIVGASWAYVLIVPGLGAIPFPTLLHQIVVALNYLNPLAYLGTHDSGRHGHVTINGGGVLAGSAELHALILWVVGLAAIAVATRLWTAREVSA